MFLITSRHSEIFCSRYVQDVGCFLGNKPILDCKATQGRYTHKPTYLTPVIFLDWSGVDLSSNPHHPASKIFDSRSSMEL